MIADRFQIERLAGEGGMGQVFRAVDRTTGAPVALKIMRDGMPPAEVNRFAREADVLDTARHPGIVRYIARGEVAEGRAFFAMEWIDGETLRDRLSRRGMTIAETVALGRRLSAALGALHRAGVVHRDLKPGNVLLRDGDPGDAVLLDLGIARRGDLERLTLTGVNVGTPGFLAPEQARGAADIDPRADVFALGCVLYECLCGQPAFAGEHPLAILGRVLLEEPRPVGSRCRPISGTSTARRWRVGSRAASPTTASAGRWCRRC